MTRQPPVRHGTVLAMAVWLPWLITALDPFNRRDWLLEILLVVTTEDCCCLPADASGTRTGPACYLPGS